MTEVGKESLTIATAPKRNQDNSLSNNNSCPKTVEICLVHSRRDRREEKMYMPDAQYYIMPSIPKADIGPLPSHMARQMFSWFIINSAVTAL